MRGIRRGLDVVACQGHMRRHQGAGKMDDQTSRPASQRVIDAADARVRDIADGSVHDAQSVQAEARCMLADYERAQRAVPRSSVANPARRARPG